METSPFSAPFSWGTQKRGLLLPRRAAAFWEGPKDLRGGTEKAEAVKLPGAGISPKQCPRKCAAEKGRPTGLSKNRLEGPGHGAKRSGETEAVECFVRDGTRREP